MHEEPVNQSRFSYWHDPARQLTRNVEQYNCSEQSAHWQAGEKSVSVGHNKIEMKNLVHSQYSSIVESSFKEVYVPVTVRSN
jgi:hypothetical protein